MAMAHAVVGATLTATFGGYGIWAGLAYAAIYWLVKEFGDLRRGGAWLDGIEDATAVWLGGWYGVWWWPAMVLGIGGYVMAARWWRWQ